jgi:hypothetical protein
VQVNFEQRIIKQPEKIIHARILVADPGDLDFQCDNESFLHSPQSEQSHPALSNCTWFTQVFEKKVFRIFWLLR